MNLLYVRKLVPEAKLPTKAHATDAGFDLYASQDIFIEKGRTVIVPTGIAIDIQPGYVGMIRDRSSMAAKGFQVGGGVIDAHYNGPVGVVLHNFSADGTSLKDQGHYLGYTLNGYYIHQGDKIAQLVIHKVESPEVRETDHSWADGRGSSGFGSSGR